MARPGSASGGTAIWRPAPQGLYDRTRANHQVARRIPPELERTILSIRRRLQAHAAPATRYSLIGAQAIRAELKALDVRPLPAARTIERMLQRNGLTAPRVRLAPLLPRQEYPGPQARASNQLHEVDLVGPIYLKGSGRRYYIWVGKDVFDGAVCLRLAGSRRMDEVLGFLGECWKDLGLPEQVQLDNARELCGWGPAARYLSRVIRFCLRFDVGPVFIPAKGAPIQRRGGELQRLVPAAAVPAALPRPGDLRRELARLQEAVNTQHVHPRLGGQTPAQHRRGLRLRKLPHELRGADGAAAVGGGSRDLHPPGESGRDGERAQPIVPGGEEASGVVPAPGDRYRAGTADGVPEWASAEALALQVVQRLTDTECTRLLAVPANFQHGNAVSEVRPSGLRDALSVRTYAKSTTTRAGERPNPNRSWKIPRSR